MDEVIVGGGNAVYQIFEDDGELLEYLLGFVGDGEGTVVDRGEVQVFEDAVDVVFFSGGFAGGYDVRVRFETIFVLGCLSMC